MSEPTEPVEPPKITPLSQPPSTEDWENFDPRADQFNLDLKEHFQPEMEQTAAAAYINALVAKNYGLAAKAAADLVAGGILSVQQAMAAIQAGPVVSVNNRSGIVTGLTETAAINLGAAAMSTAPLGQWASFTAGSGGGSDWPVAAVSWWNVLTIGTSTRTTQIGHQAFNGNYQDWTFIRRKHDSTYGEWNRIFTDTTLIERSVRTEVTTGAVSCYPANGSLQFLILKSNTTITIPAPRTAGDQLTLRIYQSGGPWSIAFSSNVKLPVGASLPTMAASQWLTLTLVPNDTATAWHAFIGGIHSNT